VSPPGLGELLHDVAARLGVPRAAAEALAFLQHSRTVLSPGWPNAYSDVAAGSLPIELSFSQASAAELRLLVEPCLPGEGILARTALGVAAVGDVAGATFTADLASRAQGFVRSLLPEGEEIPHLSWRSGLWLALRTTGEESALRVYVNAQFRDAADRWIRIGRALAASGFEGSKTALVGLRNAVAELVQPIGLCFDLRPSGLAPARVHCVTEKISPFWLLRLLSATGHSAAAADVTDFLDLFGLLERRGDCPVLLSFGLGRGEDSSLKIDVDLWSLEPSADVRREAHYLARAEARFGEIAGYHAVSRALALVEPRYIGITITPGSRFLNVYFPCPPPLPAGVPARSPSEAQARGRAFLHDQLASTDGLLMDARSSASPRAVPPGWRDVYMTSLLLQERSPVLSPGREVLERARAYLEASREGWCWRYLPELPCDLDDTAMAWAALDPKDRGSRDEVVERLTAMVNPDGGFPTFIGDAPRRQPSHPAVTLNVTFVLDRANVSWPREATDEYLSGWLHQPNFPACEWLGSRLFPIFLYARATGLLERLGSPARQRLVAEVLRMRRADGSWGGELPDSSDTALAVLSLDLLGVAIPERDLVGCRLLELQLDDGGWGWSPLYSDGSGTWFGHRAITTLFALRALEVLGVR
jgi:hypothetical protein